MSNSAYARQAVGSSIVTKPREKDDFYATVDDDVVRSLILHYEEYLPKIIWEGACGKGHMSREIARCLPQSHVFSTDLVHRGFGMGGINFLDITSNPWPGKEWALITNPPFKVSADMVRHALKLGASFVAIIGKVQYWNAQSRMALWRDHTPKANHPLLWRVDFDGRGRPTMDVQWIVFGDVPFSNEPLWRPGQ